MGQSKWCPKCGKGTFLDTQQCPHCGHSLPAAAQAARPDEPAAQPLGAPARPADDAIRPLLTRPQNSPFRMADVVSDGFSLFFNKFLPFVVLGTIVLSPLLLLDWLIVEMEPLTQFPMIHFGVLTIFSIFYLMTDSNLFFHHSLSLDFDRFMTVIILIVIRFSLSLKNTTHLSLFKQSIHNIMLCQPKKG